MSNILDFFKQLPGDILNFLKSIFTHVESEFENLSEADKQGLINGSKLAEILKQTVGQTEDQIVTAIASGLGVSADIAKGVLEAIGKDLGATSTDITATTDKLAERAQAAVTDNAWNSLWQLVAQSAAQWFTGGKFNWATLSMGVLEFVYNNFVKGK